MEKCVVSAGRIYFLDFVFNPTSRTLQQNNIVLQLRKKESDVLALLCTKYPEPVSHTEFLTEVWGGSYVTPQSIAQIIRSLRVSLGDNTKSIIVTIPKLGYKLIAEPCWKEPEIKPDKSGFETLFPEGNEVHRVPFSTQSMLNAIPVSNDPMSDIPHPILRPAHNRKKFSLQTLFLKAVTKLFFRGGT